MVGWECPTNPREASGLDPEAVHADLQQETVLHEGALRLLANGWIELPSGRLLSPDAVHHVDTYPEQES